MIYEYAIDPQILLDDRLGEFLAGSFGIHRGRLVSEFPSHWESLVYTAIETDDRPIRRAKVMEILSRLSKRLMPRNHKWDDAEDGVWLEKAEVEHDRRPFHAILAAQNPNRLRHVLLESDLNEANERRSSGRYSATACQAV